MATARWMPLCATLALALLLPAAAPARPTAKPCKPSQVRVGQKGRTWTFGTGAKGTIRCAKPAYPKVSGSPSDAILTALDGARDTYPSKIPARVRHKAQTAARKALKRAMMPRSFETIRPGDGELGQGFDAQIAVNGATLDLHFEDFTKACPTAAGKVTGRLEGKGVGKLISTPSSGRRRVLTATLTAKMTYEATVADDGRWTDFDFELHTSIVLKEELVLALNGRVLEHGPTETYDIDATGVDQPRQGVDLDASREEVHRQIDAEFDGVTIRGPENSIITRLANFRAMMTNAYLMGAVLFAGKHYLRTVSMDRAEKHWYDDEACATLDAGPDKTEGEPAEVVPVNVRDVKAADGGRFKAGLQASGAPSLTPETGTFTAAPVRFDLTLPQERGQSATWTITAIGRGGKKTAGGSVKVKEQDLHYYKILSADLHQIFRGYRAAGSPCAEYENKQDTHTAVVAAPPEPLTNGLFPAPGGGLSGTFASGGPRVGPHSLKGCTPVDPPPWPSCTESGNVDEHGILTVDVTLPPSGDAVLTWHLEPYSEGGAFTPSGCFIASMGPGTFDATGTTTEPRGIFEDAQDHFIQFFSDTEITQPDGDVLRATYLYKLGFRRINPDGTLYTGP